MGTPRNESTRSCAPVGVDAQTWDRIDWNRCEKNVRKLQMRIAKAFREGKVAKTKYLQRLLTRSYAAKCLAVKRVTKNRGKNTPGVDKEVWKTPEAKMNAVRTLKRRGYNALPLRRTYIPKTNGKLRPLGIPTMKDRVMQAIHAQSLLPIAEETADPNSYGFRPFRSTADAIDQCFKILRMRTSAQWILEGDITGCFDNFSHDWLLNHVPMDKVMLQKWLTAGYIDQRHLHPTLKGTPQGGIVSPLAANVALDGLEEILKQEFAQKEKVHLVRYADDFVITGASKELLGKKVRPLVEEFLKERGLELSEEKTRIVHITEGFVFLGQEVRKYGDKLLITPSKKNVKFFLSKVQNIIGKSKATRQDELIKTLNPLIRGWANFHRHIVAKKTFGWIDFRIWQMLWRWARRRHPNKGEKWVKKKYFPKGGTHEWTFTPSDRKGPTLIKASDTRIRRHVKIISQAHPFDPEWTPYFEERRRKRTAGKLARSVSGGLGAGNSPGYSTTSFAIFSRPSMRFGSRSSNASEERSRAFSRERSSCSCPGGRTSSQRQKKPSRSFFSSALGSLGPMFSRSPSTTSGTLRPVHGR